MWQIFRSHCTFCFFLVWFFPVCLNDFSSVTCFKSAEMILLVNMSVKFHVKKKLNTKRHLPVMFSYSVLIKAI